jgi:hypothetical protein
MPVFRHKHDVVQQAMGRVSTMPEHRFVHTAIIRSNGSRDTTYPRLESRGVCRERVNRRLGRFNPDGKHRGLRLLDRHFVHRRMVVKGVSGKLANIIHYMYISTLLKRLLD